MKGSQFERDICKDLSLWWTIHDRDDVFWRTPGSGARATTRMKVGLSTYGQCGDVQATDPEGVPFIEHFTVEIKRGYNKYTPIDLLDKPKGSAPQVWEQWLWKIEKERKENNRKGWLIVQRRDKRTAQVWMDESSFDQIEYHPRSELFCPDNVFQLSVVVRELELVKGKLRVERPSRGSLCHMVGLEWDEFLNVDPVVFGGI